MKERLHQHRAHRGVVASQPLRLHRRGSLVALGSGPRRGQRGLPAHAARHRQRREHPGGPGSRKGQERPLEAVRLRAPGLQEPRPARGGDEGRHSGAAGAPGLLKRPGAQGGRGPGGGRDQGRVRSFLLFVSCLSKTRGGEKKIKRKKTT